MLLVLQARSLQGLCDSSPVDMFASLTNFSGDGTRSIGSWNVVNVLQYSKEVSFTQGKVEDPHTACSVLCQHQHWEVFEEAFVVHWYIGNCMV